MSMGYFSTDEGAWLSGTLWRAVEGLPVRGVPLSDIHPECIEYALKLFEYDYELDRITQADLTYPIIMMSNGYIADGYHRLAKAIRSKQSTIRLVLLEQMPPSDDVSEMDPID
jgi:disulfide oxidoreductase YuzD